MYLELLGGVPVKKNTLYYHTLHLSFAQLYIVLFARVLPQNFPKSIFCKALTGLAFLHPRPPGGVEKMVGVSNMEPTLVRVTFPSVFGNCAFLQCVVHCSLHFHTGHFFSFLCKSFKLSISRRDVFHESSNYENSSHESFILKQCLKRVDSFALVTLDQ